MTIKEEIQIEEYKRAFAEAYRQGFIDAISVKLEQTKPQTCEECEHWNDTGDGCADRHGCKIKP